MRDWLRVLVMGVQAALLAFAAPALAATDPWRAFDIPQFEHVLVRDGLPHGTVTSIVQDRRGVVWMGTFGGLVRYDGYRMQVYRQAALDPKQLPDSYVRAIAPLPDGKLLIGTNAGGVVIFDPATMRFDRLPVGDHGSAHAKIFALAPAKGGAAYWIATEGGLDRIDLKTRRIAPVAGAPGADKSFDPRSFSVLEDNRGHLWLGTNAGLLLRRAGSARFEKVTAPGTAGAILADKIWALRQDSTGRLWVGSGQSGLLYLDAQLRPQLVPQLSGTEGLARRRTVRDFLETASGEIWAATDGGGVVTWNPATGEAGRITHDPAMQASLPGDITRALLQDRSGNIWIATEVGAARYNPGGRVVMSLLSSPLNPATLSDPNVHAVWIDPRRRIWLGLGMGRVDILDQKAGTIRRVRLTGEQAERDVQAFAIGPDGKVWAGSQGVARIDPDSFAVTGSLIPELDSKLVLSMAADGADMLIGTYDGLFRYSTGSRQLQQYVNDPADKRSLAGNQVRLITSMPGGETWFSTITGISIARPGQAGFTNLRNDPADARSLPQDYSGSIVRDAKGRWWFGTFGGLGRLDSLSAPYRFRRVVAGLASEKVNAVLTEGERVWASTSDGVALVDGNTLQVRNLGPREGLRIDSYIHRSAARAPDGALMFGGLGGLTVIDPAAAKPPTDKPVIAITNLVVDGVEQPFAGLPRPGDDLELAATRKGFRADFALLDYRAPAATRYSYRLDGFDDDWVRVPFGTPPAAAYTNLPAGRYTLRLRAEVGGLFPRAIETTAAIAVEPRWYETAWARIAALLLAMAAIAAIVLLRTRMLQHRAARLEALVGERTQALRDANDRLEALAGTDPLTGIANRRRFLETAAAEFERARHLGHPVSLIIVDLDHFKSVNDTYGHGVGDTVLRRAAEEAVRACRSSDLVARFGGEELVVLLPETDADGALRAADTLRRAIGVPTELDGRRIAITASAGVAEWRAPDESIPSLLDRADRALYAAKRAGRDRTLLASDALEARRAGDAA
ncbi:diguanylate cyclase [Sphingoaurantiacus capsulatus]|uniref:diguanylate cyclase n=1 Tax=Sphingoaurantiacus capsulatus TaxID=1771310 RepID=A0ABV7XDT8_9SPHN